MKIVDTFLEGLVGGAIMVILFPLQFFVLNKLASIVHGWGWIDLTWLAKALHP